MKNDRDKLFERVRAAQTYTQRTGMPPDRQADLELEAFMEIFHPEKAKDRDYMLKLKGARK
jgi:hypothetical protein